MGNIDLKQKAKENELKLLQLTTDSLVKKLSENTSVSSVRESAFQTYSEQTKEIFDVQIVVTRVEEEFLEEFQTEFTTNH